MHGAAVKGEHGEPKARNYQKVVCKLEVKDARGDGDHEVSKTV